MPFNEALDNTLHVDCVSGDESVGNRNIEFKVASYDGGVPKLQLTRVGFDGIHSKLGRMTKVEIERVRDKLTEILSIEIKIDNKAEALVDELELEEDGKKLPSDKDIPF